MHFKRGVWGQGSRFEFPLGADIPSTHTRTRQSQPPRLRSKANHQGGLQGAVQMRLITMPPVRQNACKPRRSLEPRHDGTHKPQTRAFPAPVPAHPSGFNIAVC